MTRSENKKENELDEDKEQKKRAEIIKSRKKENRKGESTKVRYDVNEDDEEKREKKERKLNIGRDILENSGGVQRRGPNITKT